MNVKVNGPKILFRIPVFGGIAITETIVNMWIIMIAFRRNVECGHSENKKAGSRGAEREGCYEIPGELGQHRNRVRGLGD